MAARHFFTLLILGSLRKGFSPIMNIALICPSSAADMISTTVRPGVGSSSTPQVRSNCCRIVGSVTL